MKNETTYDAIVIGSCMTGGRAAKELTEKGLKTLVLEAGRTVVPEEDYVEHSSAYNQAHDVKSLFTTDRGAMVSSSCVNPSLTYMALTARACDHAV